MKIVCLTLAFIISAFEGFAQLNGENILCLPRAKKGEVIQHYGYYVSYNEQHEQANWVAYELTKDEIVKTVERSNSFKPDDNVRTGSATSKDYQNSGFDRGHLAPAADLSWSARSEQESFYYSNMSPQRAGFNRGIWKSLETLVRQWAYDNDAILVITGPVLRDGLPQIGEANKISVPEYYWKVIIDYTGPEVKGIGFILPNRKTDRDIQDFVQTIDSIESLTGFDFFHAIPDDEEAAIESTYQIKSWSWSSSYHNANTNSQINKPTPSSQTNKPAPSSTAVQCSGTTKAGNRCKRKTKSPNGRCYQHGG